jgi:hypothetical protein
MKTSIRAYRILEGIQNYHKADGSSHPFLSSTSDFGEPIGYYKNPGPDGEVVEIYTEGLHWSVGDKVFEVFFSEIDRVQPTDAKESKHIIIHTKNGMLFFHASKRAARKLLRFNGDAQISRSSDQRQPTSIPRRSHRPRRVMRPNESPRYVFASPLTYIRLYFSPSRSPTPWSAHALRSCGAATLEGSFGHQLAPPRPSATSEAGSGQRGWISFTTTQFAQTRNPLSGLAVNGPVLVPHGRRACFTDQQGERKQ